jgi:hypothetical protein
VAAEDRTAPLLKAFERIATLEAIIHAAAEESPAVSEALHRAAAKVARMSPAERHNAAIPPGMRDAPGQG